MPADILRVRADLTNNIAVVQLGTVKNKGNNVFNDTLTIQQDGGPPIPFLTLPAVFPPCDWATIVLTIHGCVASSQGVLPAGSTMPTWTPAGLGFLPLVIGPPPVGAPGVTVIATGMLVGLPLPTVQPGGPPGILDHFATPGNLYKIDFQVTPLPGVFGLKEWSFNLAPGNEKVVVTAGLMKPDTEENVA